ncbi:hypothetical protein B2G71_01080 [Novosphingobium sp. PC22D]|uniref:ShlB/FhaC/HecB family hemolysin secretion/activation protein n=1 Tax=Novosphingobium sp. PC22D TaxID=1962403 RepID=UPI000BF10D72|nr:ShlB/FhaC/HecB family hemolysin secretion/activation protein [Novosphingobium sp. PC22D]PEQ14232.1 hypothetical protein B2G71_01080 [Novosphingobium sp. PC22D]
MSRAAITVSGRLAPVVLLGAMALPVAAQDAASSNLRDRTGRDAAQSMPDFAEPRDVPLVSEAPPAMPGASGTVRFSAVAVEAPGDAVPYARNGWSPAHDEASGLTLEPAEVLGPEWVEAQFARNGLIGAEVPLDRVVALVQLMNRAYVANGYINSGLLLTGAPPRDGGTLNLRLVAGRLLGEGDETVVVRFAEDRSAGLGADYVRARMPSARAVPINAIDVERDFRLLTSDPAIGTVDANLLPGDRPGEALLKLTVTPQDRYDLYLSAINNRSPSIGGERYAAGGSIRNLFAGGDLISAEAGLTGDRGDVVGAYEAPVGTAAKLLLRGSYNDAAVVDAQLKPLDIEATDWSIEGGLSAYLMRTPLLPDAVAGQWRPARSLEVGLRLAHRESKTYLLGEPFSFSPGSVNGKAQYTALRLTADYIERGVDTVIALSFTLTQGLDGTRPRIAGVLSPDRDFRVVRGAGSLAKRLTGSGLELRARLGAQWADGILYSGERYSVGGAQTVRGYRETLLLADTGVNGTLELAHPLQFGAPSNQFNWGRFTASIFADAAYVDNRKGPDPSPDTIGSVGVSLAWQPSPALSASVTYGYALKDVSIAGERDLQDRGVHFAVVFRPLRF